MLLLATWFAICASATPLYTNSSSATGSSSSSDLSNSKTSSIPTTITSQHGTSRTSDSRGQTTSVISRNSSETAYFPAQAFANFNPFYGDMLANTAVGASYSSFWTCASLWNDAFSIWMNTAPVTTGTIIPATTSTSTILPYPKATNVVVETFVTSGSTRTSTITEYTTVPPEYVTTTIAQIGPLYNVDQYFSFTASEGCCGNCTLVGSDVQVFYWLTQTQSPPISTLVNSAGFTLTSPSIYVAFRSLAAYNRCGFTGSQYAATTIAFAPGELSTSQAMFVSTSVPVDIVYDLWGGITWTKATFGAETACGSTTGTFYTYAGTIYNNLAAVESAAAGIKSIYPEDFPEDVFSPNVYTYDPCSPTISIPSKLSEINPLWKTCAPYITAFYDPPYALSQGSGFSEVASATAVAAPAGIFASTTASMTSTTTPVASSPATSPAVPTTEVQPVQIVSVASDPDTSRSIDQSGKSATTSPSSVAALTLASSVVTADQSSNFVLDSQTLTPGGQVTVAGTTVSLASNAAVAVVGGSTQTLASPAASPNNIINLGSSAVTADQSSNFVIASQTLTPGGQVTVSGVSISLASNGGFALVGGTTQTLSTASTSPVLAVGTSLVTANGESKFVVADQTLSAGAQITVSGTTISLASNTAFAVVNGVTQTLDPSSTSEYVISGQTLRPEGPAITVSGTAISLLSGGSSVVVGGTSTEALTALTGVTITTAAPLGNAILLIGGFASTTSSAGAGSRSGNNSYNGTMFLGAGAKMESQSNSFVLGLCLWLGMLGVIWL